MAWLRMNSEAQPKFLSQAFRLIYRLDAFSHPALKAPLFFLFLFFKSVSCLHNSTSFVSIHYSFFFFIFPHVTLPRFLSFTSSSIRSPPLPLTTSIITRCISISFTLRFFSYRHVSIFQLTFTPSPSLSPLEPFFICSLSLPPSFLQYPRCSLPAGNTLALGQALGLAAPVLGRCVS